MFPEENLLPISALQHYIYCPRQCALIHLEQAWAENRFTAEGRVLHKNTHEGRDESRPGVRITRGLPVRSLELGLSGQCDVVEFHKDGGVIAVEYKRGKPKAHRADEVQLCAQALCLEEMLGLSRGAISIGFLFYGRTCRRTEVIFDTDLRCLTQDTAKQVHTMIAAEKTPMVEYEKKRCSACSLIEICEPKAMRLARGAKAWFEQELNRTMKEGS